MSHIRVAIYPDLNRAVQNLNALSAEYSFVLLFRVAPGRDVANLPMVTTFWLKMIG